MAATTEERSMDTKTASAVMAIAGRAVRACDVCARERARWYCAADEAYLCGRCDNSIHCVNALASRHERLRLGPSGAPCKGGDRSPAHKNASSKSFPGLGVRKTKAGKLHARPKKWMVKDEELAQSFLSNPDDTIVPGYPDPLLEDQGTQMGLPAYVPEFHGTVEHGMDSATSDGYLSPEMPQELDALERGTCDEDLGNGSDDSDEYLDFSDIVTEADFLDDNGEEGSVFKQEDVKSEYNLDAVNGESCAHLQPSLSSESFAASNVKVEKNVSLLQECSKEGQRKLLSLKLNYEDVLSAWSGRGPLLTEDCDLQTVPILSNLDAALNLDLESYHREQLGEVPVLGIGDEAMEVGGGREARVMRYREKRRTRLFSKQIRYEVRKLNAERRPRMKGRFVKRLPP